MGALRKSCSQLTQSNTNQAPQKPRLSQSPAPELEAVLEQKTPVHVLHGLLDQL